MLEIESKVLCILGKHRDSLGPTLPFNNCELTGGEIFFIHTILRISTRK